MSYRKIYYLILVIDGLFLIFMGLISYRFFKKTYTKTKKTDPQVLHQYEIKVDLDKYRTLLNETQKSANP